MLVKKENHDLWYLFLSEEFVPPVILQPCLDVSTIGSCGQIACLSRGRTKYIVQMSILGKKSRENVQIKEIN